MANLGSLFVSVLGELLIALLGFFFDIIQNFIVPQID